MFDCDRFLSLKGDELIRYAEPFVTTKVGEVPSSAYDVLYGKLDELSDVHTVYALEICMRINAQGFTASAIRFLSHPDSSVCCAACRVIESLSPEAISAELRNTIAATPVVELFSWNPRSGERICVGTNQGIIDALVDRFTTAQPTVEPPR